MENIFQFSIENSKKELISMEKYRGNVLLIVNTATRCGYTKQLNDFEALYKKYRKQGLEIIGFPCNQFLKQAPEEINEFIEICRLKYGVSFEQFNKINVNGVDTIPLYKYLKNQIPNSLGTKRILWNFEKFIINRNGKVVNRLSKNCDFNDVINAVETALKK